jgi:hypothetical protein
VPDQRRPSALSVTRNATEPRLSCPPLDLPLPVTIMRGTAIPEALIKPKDAAGSAAKEGAVDEVEKMEPETREKVMRGEGQEPVASRELRPLDLSPKNRQLLPEGKILGGEGSPGHEERPQEQEHELQCVHPKLSHAERMPGLCPRLRVELLL